MASMSACSAPIFSLTSDSFNTGIEVLYSKDRHVKLDPIKWDEDAARAEIRDIVRDTEAALRSGSWWPQHPLDEHPADAPSDKTLYLGAAGVMWALEFLAARKTVTLARSYETLWQTACEDYQRDPDTGENVPSWFLGDSALLLLCMLRGPASFRAEAAHRLRETIAANAENPTWEILWGSPGTMLAALFAFEATGEEIWSDLYRHSAARLLNEWTFHEERNCHLWTQDLYQHRQVLYGAGHGFAGNAFALLRGSALLDQEQRRTLLSRVAETTKRLAMRADGLANWAPSSAEPKPDKILLQWCHGAPGFLLSIASRYPTGIDHDLERLFLEAGELVWKAGPLVKGACFCHGTDGNGMALLALYQRTNDTKWLERARTFGMNALHQARQRTQAHGRRRYTLWTGDLGLAVFLQAAIDGKAHMPTLDFI